MDTENESLETNHQECLCLKLRFNQIEKKEVQVCLTNISNRNVKIPKVQKLAEIINPKLTSECSESKSPKIEGSELPCTHIIPPESYEEVKQHIKEMFTGGTI